MISITQDSLDSSYTTDSAESTPSFQDMENQIISQKQKEPKEIFSHKLVCIQETGTEISEFSESQSEGSKRKIQQKTEKSIEVKIQSQIKKFEDVQKCQKLQIVQKTKQQAEKQKNEIAFNHTLKKIYELYQKSIVKNSVNNKPYCRLQKELNEDKGENEIQEQGQLQQIRKGFSKIAKKMGSIALAHPHQQLPISKRTRKQLVMQRKIQLQNKKQVKMKVCKLKNQKITNNPAEKCNSKEKEDVKSSSQAQDRTATSVSIVDASRSNCKNMKRSRPISKTPEKHNKKTVFEEKKQEQNGFIYNSISRDSCSKNKKPKKVRVLQIREIQNVGKNFLEFLLNFSDGSIEVLITDELVKLWPEEFGEYLCKKTKF